MNVPVLARLFESVGFSTVLVTNMPHWAEKIGVPRTLGIEYPYGHIMGHPNDQDGQLRVLRQALDVLESAQAPGTIVCSTEKWSGTLEEAQAVSHPDNPPPIMDEMASHIGKFLRGMRRKG